MMSGSGRRWPIRVRPDAEGRAEFMGRYEALQAREQERVLIFLNQLERAGPDSETLVTGIGTWLEVHLALVVGSDLDIGFAVNRHNCMITLVNIYRHDGSGHYRKARIVCSEANGALGLQP